MNIYKVTRISEWSYDDYSSFVCFARNEEEAKNLNPSYVDIYHENFYKYLNDPKYHLSFFMNWEELSDRRDWVESKDDLIVVKLGTSELSDSQQIGIILTSYHAG